MEPENRAGDISRRRMLKRIGAGAAIAWSAPVLTSLRIPAFAQAGSPVCQDCACFAAAGPCPGNPDCLCDRTMEGTCVCDQELGLGDCTTTAQCEAEFGAGTHCICFTEASGICVRECGGAGAAGTISRS